MSDTADKTSLKDIADKDSDKDADKTADKSRGKSRDKAAPEKAPERAAGDRPKSGGGFVWFVLLFIIAGGAVAAGWPFIGPKVQPIIAEARTLMGLDQRPTQARLPSETSLGGARVAPAPVVEATPEPAVEPTVEPTAEAAPEPEMDAEIVPDVPVLAGADAGELAVRLDALENQIATLRAMSGDSGQAALDATNALTHALSNIKNELAALSDRLQAMEEGTRADPTAPAQALVLGITQLRSRLMGDGAFAAELAALESIAGGDAKVTAALQRLNPHADVGVPSEAALTARFAKVAKAIVGARSTSEADGWLGNVKDSLGGLVTVRRTDPAEITDAVERAVAIAEAALELGELGEAVTALNVLEGAPGDAAAAWLGDAHARVDAEAALEDLHSHALAVLSAAGGR